MFKVDFNKQAVNFKNELSTTIDKDGNLYPVFIGEQIGACLCNTAEKDNNKIVKYWSWATLLGKGDCLTLDKADLNLLKDFILQSELTLWIKAQVL
jgi:hypothetical protein